MRETKVASSSFVEIDAVTKGRIIWCKHLCSLQNVKRTAFLYLLLQTKTLKPPGYYIHGRPELSNERVGRYWAMVYEISHESYISWMNQLDTYHWPMCLNYENGKLIVVYTQFWLAEYTNELGEVKVVCYQLIALDDNKARSAIPRLMPEGAINLALYRPKPLQIKHLCNNLYHNLSFCSRILVQMLVCLLLQRFKKSSLSGYNRRTQILAPGNLDIILLTKQLSTNFKII